MRTHAEWRPQVVAALERAGHSPTKALEIAIDAERGDMHAVSWIGKATDYPFEDD